MQFWRMIAGPVSLAVLGSIMFAQIGVNDQSRASVPPATLADAMQHLFLTDAAIVAVGLIASLFLKEIPLP